MNTTSLTAAIRFASCFAIAWSAATTSATAGSVFTPVNTLTFDELPFQSVDGLSHAGVTFDFKVSGVSSPDAFYHSFGPGSQPGVDDPSLTGDSDGVLGLDFDVPTSILEFDIALSTADALTPGLLVELFDVDLLSLGVLPVNVVNVGGQLGFSEGRFTHQGERVRRAVVQFELPRGSFAVDNLTYETIPEPSAAALLGMLSLTMISAFSRRV